MTFSTEIKRPVMLRGDWGTCPVCKKTAKLRVKHVNIAHGVHAFCSNTCRFTWAIAQQK